jgi:hypothetical protein
VLRKACILAVVAGGSVFWACEEPGPPTEEPAPSAGPVDALSRRFGKVRAGLRERGYAELRPLQRTFVVEGTGVSVPLDLPTGRCTTVAALAGGGMRDLRLTLLDGVGVEVAVDGVPGEGGLVHVCPEGAHEHASHHLVMEALEGFGVVDGALFESEAGRGGGLDGLFDGSLAPSVPFRDVEEQLARTRETLQERGFVPLGLPRVDVVAEGEVLREAVELVAGHCYVAVARSGEGVRDVDLFLFGVTGAEVARNMDSDAQPSLEHCPDQTGRHVFEVRAFEGAGAVGLMVATGAVAADEAPGSDEEVRRPVGPAVAEEGAPDVTASLRSRGYEVVQTLREPTMMPGEVRSHDVVLGPGCAVVVGVPGAPGMDVDLYLVDAEGAKVDQDARVDPSARVSACPAEAAPMRVLVKAYGHEAPYVLFVLKAPPDVRVVRDMRLDEADGALRTRGYVRGRTLTLDLATGEKAVVPLQVPAGGCIAMAAAGEARVEDLDLFLRSADGQLLASDAGPAPWGAVTRCAPSAESLSLELLMYRGAGAVVVVQLDGPG